MPTARAAARKALQDGDYQTAIERYQASLAEDPGEAGLYLELSSCLLGTNQIDEALVVAKQARLHATTDFAFTCDKQIARIYLQQERFDAAGQLYNRLLEMDPNDADARGGLANLYMKTGFPARALALLRPLNRMHDADWVMNVSIALFQSRDVDGALDLILAYLAHHAPRADLLSNALMFTNYTGAHDAYREKLRSFIAQIYPAKASQVPRAQKTKKLRVGFVSADFNWHPVGYFFQSFLPQLTKLGAETYLFSNGATEDSLTTQMRRAATGFVSIYNRNTADSVALIQKHQIDILIDLAGHTAGHRLDIFAARAAPAQAGYLGYPESTLVPGMDYVLTDAIHVPEDERKNFSEEIVYLPDTRFCFMLPLAAPAMTPPPMKQNGYVTLGSFANPAKIGAACARNWGDVLLAVPEARLKLRHRQWDDDDMREALLGFWQKMGIAPGRIEFYGHGKYDRYLKSYGELDLVLDTEPFSGATTTCEALWMGVPVVTRSGGLPASRQGVSILRAIGEDFWIARDARGIIDIVKKVQRDPGLLCAFQKGIRGKITQSSLGNGETFAHTFYRALMQIQGRI